MGWMKEKAGIFWVLQMSSIDLFWVMQKRKTEIKVESVVFHKGFYENLAQVNKIATYNWKNKYFLNCYRDSMGQNKGQKAVNKHLLSLTPALALPSCSIRTSNFLKGVVPLLLYLWNLGGVIPAVVATCSGPDWVSPTSCSQSIWVREEHMTQSSQWDSTPGIPEIIKEDTSFYIIHYLK